MDPKATTRRTHKLKVRPCRATKLCSISSTGVVFLSGQPLEVSSDITLSVQTKIMGLESDWPVQGWVVECLECLENPGSYQVTLLFSELPSSLKKILSLAEECRSGQTCPRVPGAELYGLN